MDEKLAYRGAAGPLRNMRLIGCCRLDLSCPGWQRRLHTAYRCVMFPTLTLNIFQMLVQCWVVRDDLDRMTDNLLLLFSCTDMLYKDYAVLARADKIEELLNVLRGPIFNKNIPKHRQILQRMAINREWLLRLYNLLSVAIASLWGVFPFILHFKGKTVEFNVWFPFDEHVTPRFYVVVVYVWLQVAISAFLNSTLDIFITYFLAQYKTQITILNFAAKFQDIFDDVIAYQFLVSGGVLCTTAYRMAKMDVLSIPFLSLAMYMVCMLTQSFLYCYFGNEVIYESQGIIDSAYSMDWVELPVEGRRSLLIFMERVKRHIVPKAGVIIPLSADTYVRILRASYTFYTVLKQTDERL